VLAEIELRMLGLLGPSRSSKHLRL